MQALLVLAFFLRQQFESEFFDSSIPSFPYTLIPFTLFPPESFPVL